MSDVRKMVAIDSFNQAIDADMAKIYFDCHGVDCEIQSDLLVSVNPMISNAVGGVKLLVAEEDIEDALELLKEYREKLRQDELAIASKCPNCESNNTDEIKRSIIVSVFVVLTLGIWSFFIPWFKYRCNECRHEW